MSIIYLRKIPAYLLLLMFLLPVASAQEISAVPATLTISDGTAIKLQLAENVSSTSSVWENISKTSRFVIANGCVSLLSYTSSRYIIPSELISVPPNKKQIAPSFCEFRKVYLREIDFRFSLKGEKRQFFV